MSTVRASDLRGALLRKGFVSNQSHHEMFQLVIDGRPTEVGTRLSHGVKECDPWLLGQVARQMRISKAELLRFVECSLSAEEYAAQVRQAPK